MSDRLYHQLEEMEQQLSNLKGAIEALRDAEAASNATIAALDQAQEGLSTAYAQFVPKLEEHFSDFSKESKEILDDISTLLSKLEKLDVAALTKLIDRNKEELGVQSKEQLDAQLIKIREQLELSNGDLGTKIDKSLQSLDAKTSEVLTENAAKERAALEELLKEQTNVLDINHDELRTRLRTEGLELRESWRKHEDATEELLSDSVEKTTSAISQNEAGIKQAKTFSMVAAIAASAAFIVSLVGLFL